MQPCQRDREDCRHRVTDFRAIEGRFDVAGVWRDCQDVALFSSFEDMLVNIERTYR